MIDVPLSRPSGSSNLQNLLDKLNSAWHKYALWVYFFIVVAHLSEHLVQVFQIFVLGWAKPDSRGILGQWIPWLIKSEALHYGYAIIMLVAFFLLRPGFVGRSRLWWDIALGIQFWHHIEHALLQGQAIVGQNLFGSPVPISIVQLWIPRVELHFLYNTIVFVPMLLAMYYHMYPPAGEEVKAKCNCVRGVCALPSLGKKNVASA
jgi:hypothetical protein